MKTHSTVHAIKEKNNAKKSENIDPEDLMEKYRMLDAQCDETLNRIKKRKRK